MIAPSGAFVDDLQLTLSVVSELLRLLLIIVLPLLLVLGVLTWWVRRSNLPPEMRWPRRNRPSRRRTERDVIIRDDD